MSGKSKLATVDLPVYARFQALSQRKKQRLKVMMGFVALYALLVPVVLSLVLEMEPQRSAPFLPSLNESQIQMTERAARKLFAQGDWHFREMQVESNVVKLFIEIPGPLDLSIPQQQNYIVKSVCPKLGNPLFRKVDRRQVRIYLINDWKMFGYKKSGAVDAYCA